MLSDQVLAMEFDRAFEQPVNGGIADAVKNRMFERLAWRPFEDGAAIECEQAFLGRIGLNIVVAQRGRAESEISQHIGAAVNLADAARIDQRDAGRIDGGIALRVKMQV